jgi:hypothetical protein
MIHPDTEIRIVHPTIGYGVVATRFIPRGTITWVHDDLDQTFSPEQLAGLTPLLRDVVLRLVHRVGDTHILCWDHARFMNHACEATCLSPAACGFDVAVRDIAAGEQLTADYGSFDVDRSFACQCGSPMCRKQIRPDDMLTCGERWDLLFAGALERVPEVPQPLWELVPTKDKVIHALGGR